MLGKYFVIIITVDNKIHFNFRHIARVCVEEGKADVYGFLDPQMIQQSGNQRSEIQSYVTGCWKNSGKRIFMAPYVNQ